VTPAIFFSAARALPLASIDDLLGSGGALIIAPHPDDESLGCGALMAATAEAGRSAAVVVVSDGAGSHPGSKAYPPERLRSMREEEAMNAAACLGLPAEAIGFLRLPDRLVPAAGEGTERAVDAIVSSSKAIGAAAMFVTWRLDPHCDHRAAYALARAAQRRLDGVRLFEYVVWGERLALDQDPAAAPRGFRFEGGRYRSRKRAAIACHRSQTTRLIDDDPEGFMLDPAMIEASIDLDEIFLEMPA
jgi:LmbE family N-acetylglucosaminyl deacetylase